MPRHFLSPSEFPPLQHSRLEANVLRIIQIHPKVHRDQIDVEQNLGTLLMEFFELYGRNFNFDVEGISILRGGAYYAKARKGFLQHNKPFLLSIEDPQQPGAYLVWHSSTFLPRTLIFHKHMLTPNLDNDIASGSFGIRQVRQAFSGAHDMLQVRLFQRVDDILARRTGRYEGGWVPEEMSLLSAIMGATKEVS